MLIVLLAAWLVSLTLFVAVRAYVTRNRRPAQRGPWRVMHEVRPRDEAA